MFFLPINWPYFALPKSAEQNADLTFKCWGNLQQLAFVFAPNLIYSPCAYCISVKLTYEISYQWTEKYKGF